MKLETPEWKVASKLCWFTWQNGVFPICLSLFLILKEKQEINFRKIKKLMKNLTKYLKKYCCLHLKKKKFSPWWGDKNKQFFYFGPMFRIFLIFYIDVLLISLFWRTIFGNMKSPKVKKSQNLFILKKFLHIVLNILSAQISWKVLYQKKYF